MNHGTIGYLYADAGAERYMNQQDYIARVNRATLFSQCLTYIYLYSHGPWLWLYPGKVYVQVYKWMCKKSGHTKKEVKRYKNKIARVKTNETRRSLFCKKALQRTLHVSSLHFPKCTAYSNNTDDEAISYMAYIIIIQHNSTKLDYFTHAYYPQFRVLSFCSPALASSFYLLFDDALKIY